MPPNQQFASDLSDALRHVLREAREGAGFSLGEVAALSGLNRQGITFIEQGDRRPTTETVARLSLALGLRPSEAWAKAEARIPAREWKRNQISPPLQIPPMKPDERVILRRHPKR